ncbi:nickel pincer cofactor biosynthesis protein LarC, partial [Actinoplanes sp. NPDC048791]|uniref:nickel pincer cofactor biosynthesis protein LarC n=1 Tax=Actinoplanes sp. NPDC048791 TaxID=3154623 RepID=UPI0033C3FE80
LPGSIALTATTVTRAGLRALKVDAQPLVADPPHRTFHGIRELLAHAALAGRVRDRAGAVFARLADAEARVHGVPVDDVHFHEVGALDSIADVVGVCAALEELDVGTVSAGEVAVGSGRTRSGHGDLPVPVPAVAQLARGWRVRAGGTGELATPTGMAAIRALATSCEDLPAMAVEEVGSGAGGRDTPGRANVVRVLVGVLTAAEPAESMMMLETNVDDLDPRLWPGVLAGLLADGAADAWLVPIVMKKGRPAHTLSVLCRPQRAGVLRERMLRDTSTLGVREQVLHRYAVPRTFVDIELDGGTIAVKVAHRDGVITQVMPEFDDVAAAARRLERPERLVLQQAAAAA